MLPPLGHSIRAEWDLDPDFLIVNHGSFGATPRSVTACQHTWQDRMERQPSRFMSTIYPAAIRGAADALGSFLQADGRTSSSSITQRPVAMRCFGQSG
jgi:isopenicillin-N epimerase